jgi:hypothetical protein
MDNDKREQIEILSADYKIDTDLTKLKIKKISTEEQIVWALDGNSLDSLINQLINKSLIFSKEQRKKLVNCLVGKIFYCKLNADMSLSDMDDIKDASIDKLLKFHDIVDRYPFYEVQKEIMGEKEDV